MNHIYKLFLLASLCLSTKLSAQIVNIPDANFKAALLAHSPVINTNGDGEIQVSEAQAFTNTLLVQGRGISNLKGIEAFTSIRDLCCFDNQLNSLDLTANTALTGLYCHNNQLSSLKLTTNTSLTELQCYNNQLTSLDFSTNIALKSLHCSANLLTSLDFSTNTALLVLSCYFNQITSLNLTANTALELLYCFGNQLTSLDLTSNNALIELGCYDNQLTSLNLSSNPAIFLLECFNNQLTSLDIRNGNNMLISGDYMKLFGNPDLICVSVDDPIWSAANWPNKDPQTQFSSNCNLSHLEDLDEDQKESIKLYPNPTNGTFHLDLGQVYTDAKFKITDMQGREITQQQLSNQQQLEMELQEAAGVYLVHIYSGEGLVSTLRLVKE